MQANSGGPDQTPRSAASYQGMNYLPMSLKKDARLIWVKVSTQLCILVQIILYSHTKYSQVSLLISLSIYNSKVPINIRVIAFLNCLLREMQLSISNYLISGDSEALLSRK